MAMLCCLLITSLLDQTKRYNTCTYIYTQSSLFGYSGNTAIYTVYAVILVDTIISPLTSSLSIAEDEFSSERSLYVVLYGSVGDCIVGSLTLRAVERQVCMLIVFIL